MTRDQWIKKFESMGARVANTVSSKTDLLIVGAEPGQTKLSAAAEKGVPTLSIVMLTYLGFFEPRGQYRLSLPQDLIAQLLLNMAIICEDIYVSATTPRGWRTFERSSMAVESVLRAAYGKPTPDWDAERV